MVMNIFRFISFHYLSPANLHHFGVTRLFQWFKLKNLAIRVDTHQNKNIIQNIYHVYDVKCQNFHLVKMLRFRLTEISIVTDQSKTQKYYFCILGVYQVHVISIV